MRLLYGDIKDFKSGKNVAAIGIFDGVHLGHKAILDAVKKEARLERSKPSVITFWPHPANILRPDQAPKLILSLSHKIKILKEMGIANIAVIKFTKRLSRMSAEEFIKDVAAGEFNASHIVIGENFYMGRGKEADAKTLKRIAEKAGIKVSVIKGKKQGVKMISSTLIRHLIITGELTPAKKLLGRPYSIFGTVVHGKKIGRVLGFPTANLNLHHEAIPPAGVYAAVVRLGQTNYKGIVNIGFKHDFHKFSEGRVEAHIFNFNKDIYGKDAEVFFIKRIRAERHFKNREHLRAQICRDVKRAYFLA